MYRTIAAAVCVAAGLASAGAIAAPAAKPTDPQIAHIAYTADQLDIEAGKQALVEPTLIYVRRSIAVLLMRAAHARHGGH